jgi:hypothetical protein
MDSENLHSPPETRVVLYDHDEAFKTLLSITHHTEYTMDALNAAPKPVVSNWPPPMWKNCCLSWFCVRQCGPDGLHLKNDGTPGGRGQCKKRDPGFGFVYPPGVKTFDEEMASNKKRKRAADSPVHSPSYEPEAASISAEEAARASAEAARASAAYMAHVARQAAAQPMDAEPVEAEPVEAEPVEAIPMPPTNISSDLEAIRASVAAVANKNRELEMKNRELEMKNRELEGRIIALEGWKARQMAAFIS